jgi:1,4-dihydroxy-2-naphthoyl-CoA hydrolase
MEPTPSPVTVDELNAIGEGKFPGHIGFRVVAVERGRVEAEFDVAPHHLAPNGYLHAGSIVTLADTACGYGVRTAMPEGGVGFTTIELKSNFLGTALEGTLRCVAGLVHGGRTTQVWDATVTAADRTVALFRCTQLILYPRG